MSFGSEFDMGGLEAPSTPASSTAVVSEEGTPDKVVAMGQTDEDGFEISTGMFEQKKWIAPGKTQIIVDRHGGYSNCMALYGVDPKDESAVPAKGKTVPEPSAKAVIEGINRFKTHKSQKYMANVFQIGNDAHFQVWYDTLATAYPVRDVAVTLSHLFSNAHGLCIPSSYAA